MNKQLACCIVSVLSVIGVLRHVVAEPVSAETAKHAVSTWLLGRPRLERGLGATAESVKSCVTNGAAFHVVALKGGGFVVTSADTKVEPIVAFADSGSFEESEKNPLFALLTRDLPSRSPGTKLMAMMSNGIAPLSATEKKWAQLTAPKPVAQPTTVSNGMVFAANQFAAGYSAITDERVAPLLETEWSQELDKNYYNDGDPCYNYYTPSNYPCGCVATAGAQMMRYHRYPTGYVTPKSFACGVETGKNWIAAYSYEPKYSDVQLTMQGGVYDWNSMPAIPANGTTLEQRQAIGKLTSDVGIACGMKYGENFSGTGGYMLLGAFLDTFGYTNAVAGAYPSGVCDMSTFRAAVLPNLDARLPVAVSICGNGGHEVVADGYGYIDNTLYVHFNMGWAGISDAWYAPPDIEEFNAVDGFVCNVYPSGAAGGVICSGRVLSPSNDLPVAGAVVYAQDYQGARPVCVTDNRGIYALILSSGSHTLIASNDLGCCSKGVVLTANVSIELAEQGGYWETPEPQINNRYDMNFCLESSATGSVQEVLADGGPYYEWVDDVCWSFYITNGVAVIRSQYEYGRAISSVIPSDVSIPSSLGGCQVVGIGNYAFASCAGMETVEIPDTVEWIGNNAFGWCRSLTEVEIPDSVTDIGELAFACCDSLTNLVVGSGVVNIPQYGWLFAYESREYTNEQGQLCHELSKGSLSLEYVELHSPAMVPAFIDGYFPAVTQVIVGEEFAELPQQLLWAFPALETIELPYGITEIPAEYFYGVGSLMSVEIPETVTNIGEYAFYNCTNLEYVYMHEGLLSIGDRAFEGCTILECVDLPSTLQTLGVGSFADCQSLTEVEIPDSVTSIGEYAFDYCDSLTRLVVGSGVVNIPESGEVFGYRVAVTNSNGEIDYYYYYKGSLSLEYVELHSPAMVPAFIDGYFPAVTEIVLGDEFTEPLGMDFIVAFPALEKITAPEGVLPSFEDGIAIANGHIWHFREVEGGVELYNYTSNGWQCAVEPFYGEMRIPDYIYDMPVVSIGECAFGWCWGYDGDKIIIGNNVTNIEANAFAYDGGISVEVADGNEWFVEVDGVVYDRDFTRVVFCSRDVSEVSLPDTVRSFDTSAFQYCYDLQHIEIPEGVTSLDSTQLFSYSGLEDIVLPTTLKSLGFSAFMRCDYLRNIDLPDSLEYIDGQAFDMSGLDQIVIPDAVREIGSYAFGWCRSLSNVVVGAAVTEIGYYAFYGDTNLTTMVFNGNAPAVMTGAFNGVPSNCVVYVNRGSTGWGVDIPGVWNGLRIEYRQEAGLPDLGENPSDEQVAAVLRDADTNLVANIDKDNYNDFCDWTGSLVDEHGDPIPASVVLASPGAWQSFALDLGVLLEMPIEDEDLKIEEFKPTAVAGKFDFTVSVEGVEVGSEASKENLKKVFGLEGASELGSGFSADNVDISFGEPENGNVKFTAGPKDATQKSFFMKMKVK